MLNGDKSSAELTFLFGPVLSRRLGISLGVDLVPPKTCQLNCVYCEAGKTTFQTIERKEFFPLSEIKNELQSYLSLNPKLDFITFSGQGEPTLYSKLGELILFLKTKFPRYKICLITNGILIGKNNIPEELKGLDLVIPSLDASDEETFHKINRPHKSLTLNSLVQSIINFRKKNPAQMWLEIFIVPGLNDSQESIANFAKIISEIKPDKIQLNSLDRPGTEPWIMKPDPETFLAFQKALSIIAPVEIISRKGQESKIDTPHQKLYDEICNLIARRPCTEDEIAKLFSLSQEETSQIIKKLLSSGKFITQEINSNIFIKKRD